MDNREQKEIGHPSLALQLMCAHENGEHAGTQYLSGLQCCIGYSQNSMIHDAYHTWQMNKTLVESLGFRVWGLGF